MKENPKSIEYEERITAFVDILGFKAFLNNPKTTAEDIFNVLAKQNDIALSNKDIVSDKTDLRIQSFSDNIVISVENSSDGFSELVCYLIDLFVASLDAGLFIRGGIDVANLYQNESENVVFGPGLVKAYELESIHAGFPRIILSNKLTANIHKWNADDASSAFHQTENDFSAFCDMYIRQANDGPYYINVLHDLFRFEPRENLPSIKSSIEEALKNAADRPIIFAKLRKFCDNWNKELVVLIKESDGQLTSDEVRSMMIGLPQF